MTLFQFQKLPAAFIADRKGSVAVDMAVLVAMAMIGAVSSADLVGTATQSVSDQMMVDVNVSFVTGGAKLAFTEAD